MAAVGNRVVGVGLRVACTDAVGPPVPRPGIVRRRVGHYIRLIPVRNVLIPEPDLPANTPEIDRFLPLKPVVFHILLALSEAPSHGYGVIQSVRRRSDGRIELQTGAFYRYLRRLLDDGLVEERPSPPDDDPRRGAYYRVTAPGRALVRAEWQRMSALVAVTEELGVIGEEEAS